MNTYKFIVSIYTISKKMGDIHDIRTFVPSQRTDWEHRELATDPRGHTQTVIWQASPNSPLMPFGHIKNHFYPFQVKAN
jgi:hypothetical protein